MANRGRAFVFTMPAAGLEASALPQVDPWVDTRYDIKTLRDAPVESEGSLLFFKSGPVKMIVAKSVGCANRGLQIFLDNTVRCVYGLDALFARTLSGGEQLSTLIFSGSNPDRTRLFGSFRSATWVFLVDVASMDHNLTLPIVQFVNDAAHSFVSKEWGHKSELRSYLKAQCRLFQEPVFDVPVERHVPICTTTLKTIPEWGVQLHGPGWTPAAEIEGIELVILGYSEETVLRAAQPAVILTMAHDNMWMNASNIWLEQVGSECCQRAHTCENHVGHVAQRKTWMEEQATRHLQRRGREQQRQLEWQQQQQQLQQQQELWQQLPPPPLPQAQQQAQLQQLQPQPLSVLQQVYQQVQQQHAQSLLESRLPQLNTLSPPSHPYPQQQQGRSSPRPATSTLSGPTATAHSERPEQLNRTAPTAVRGTTSLYSTHPYGSVAVPPSAATARSAPQGPNSMDPRQAGHIPSDRDAAAAAGGAGGAVAAAVAGAEGAVAVAAAAAAAAADEPPGRMPAAAAVLEPATSGSMLQWSSPRNSGGSEGMDYSMPSDAMAQADLPARVVGTEAASFEAQVQQHFREFQELQQSQEQRLLQVPGRPQPPHVSNGPPVQQHPQVSARPSSTMSGSVGQQQVHQLQRLTSYHPAAADLPVTSASQSMWQSGSEAGSLDAAAASPPNAIIRPYTTAVAGPVARAAPAVSGWQSPLTSGSGFPPSAAPAAVAAPAAATSGWGTPPRTFSPIKSGSRNMSSGLVSGGGYPQASYDVSAGGGMRETARKDPRPAGRRPISPDRSDKNARPPHRSHNQGTSPRASGGPARSQGGRDGKSKGGYRDRDRDRDRDSGSDGRRSRSSSRERDGHRGKDSGRKSYGSGYSGKSWGGAGDGNKGGGGSRGGDKNQAGGWDSGNYANYDLDRSYGRDGDRGGKSEREQQRDGREDREHGRDKDRHRSRSGDRDSDRGKDRGDAEPQDDSSFGQGASAQELRGQPQFEARRRAASPIPYWRKTFTAPSTGEHKGYVVGFDAKLDEKVIRSEFKLALAFKRHEVIGVVVRPTGGRSGGPAYALVDFESAEGLAHAVGLQGCSAACHLGKFLKITVAGDKYIKH